MSKRLFIWIGLIVLIGVIAAAGWSLYTTINRPAAEPPPPVARGKIPQMPATASGKVVHRAPVPHQTPQQSAAKAVPDSDTPEAVPSEPSARISPGVTFNAASEPAMRTETADTAQPAAEPEATASDESPASRSTVASVPTSPAPGTDRAPSGTPEQARAVESPSAEPAAEPETDLTAKPTPGPASDSQAATQAQTAPEQTPASPPPAQARRPRPAPAVQAPAQSPPPEPQKQEPFTIQVGAYRNKVYAEDMRATLARKGYEPYIFEDTDARSHAWYVVRFGRFATRQAAQWALSAYRDKERKDAIIAKTGVR